MKVTKFTLLKIMALLIVLAFLGYQALIFRNNILANTPIEPHEVSQLTVTPLPLYSDARPVTKVGNLTYRWGVKLESEEATFGGMSALHLMRNKRKNNDAAITLSAVSDMGNLVEIDLKDNDKSVQINRIFMDKIPGTSEGKGANDAEAITYSNGRRLIGFERNHRVTMDTKPLPMPAIIKALKDNGGIEALTILPDGRLFMAAEKELDEDSEYEELIADGLGPYAWVSYEPVNATSMTYIKRQMRGPEGYNPTDAATLDNGDLLILFRRFRPIEGVSAKLLHVTADTLAGEGVITGKVLAHLTPEMNIDNMEGLAINPQGGGQYVVYMISDDNFNPMQKTVLMSFDLHVSEN